MQERSNVTRSSRNRRTTAILTWSVLVIAAGLLWYGRQTSQIRSIPPEPVALLLSGYAAFVSIFAWMLFSPSRRTMEDSMTVFFAGAATLFPPTIISFCLMPVDSPFRVWLSLVVFLLCAISVLSPIPEEFFAIPRERHSYLRPISGSMFDRLSAAEPGAGFEIPDHSIPIDYHTHREIHLEGLEPPVHDPWADPFRGTGVRPTRVTDQAGRGPHEQRKPAAAPSPLKPAIRTPAAIAAPAAPIGFQAPRPAASTPAHTAPAPQPPMTASPPPLPAPSLQQSPPPRPALRDRQPGDAPPPTPAAPHRSEAVHPGTQPPPLPAADHELDHAFGEWVSPATGAATVPLLTPVTPDRTRPAAASASTSSTTPHDRLAPQNVEQPGTDQQTDDTPVPGLELERIEDEYGGQMIEGTMKIRFEPGQKRANIHIPFSPPLPGIPEVECEAIGADFLRLKVPVRQSYGIRIEARRSESAQPLDTEIGFAAVYAPPGLRR